MADNTAFVASLDPAAPKIADKEVEHSGELAKVQLIQLVHVTGTEGAYTLSELDDFSAAIGQPADASATTDTGTFSLLSLFKRSLEKLTALAAQLPASLTTNGSSLKTGASDVVLTASVAAGQTVQGSGLDVGGLRNWGVLVPSTFDGTQIQFQMCDSFGGTYVGVYDITNTRVVMTVAAGRFYDIPGELMAIRFLKIECVTAQAGTATDFLIIGKT